MSILFWVTVALGVALALAGMAIYWALFRAGGLADRHLESLDDRGESC